MARKTYTDAQKDRIVKFTLSRGRGGIAAAQKKFKVSYVAIRAWMGGPQPATVNKRKSIAKIDGRKARRIKTALRAVKSLQKQANRLGVLIASL